MKYCLVENERCFVPPTADDVRNSRIVVTTLETSLVLTRLRLKSLFTHIFIDEAAQANECRAIMPLSLADEKTCVVFAGDHMQMTDEVHSKEAKEHKFHHSIIERLIYLYDQYKNVSLDKPPPKVLLTANYRNHWKIVSFIARVFYGEKENLLPKNHQLDVANLEPLAFFATIGIEEYSNSSVCNLAEVEEVVDQVNFLYENWPTEWEERNAEKILVTSAYTDQVNILFFHIWMI